MSELVHVRVIPVGDAALAVICGTEESSQVEERVAHVLDTVRQLAHGLVEEWVGGYLWILGRIDPKRIAVKDAVERLATSLVRQPFSHSGTTANSTREVPVPVVFGGDYGPDLKTLADRLQMTEESIVRRYLEAAYRVRLIGFVPGFPYLSGLPSELSSPRRDVPRVQVPAGSVGIAGSQTGIYPAATPGGWQLIGRTPMRMFDVFRNPPSVLQPGDIVRFERICADEYESQIADRPAQKLVGGEKKALENEGGLSQTGIEIMRPGLLTTVQDLGRKGFACQGMALTGAMDRFAASAANLLVGNNAADALLECTLVGPTLRFQQDALICVTGANLQPRLNHQNIPMWKTVQIPAGGELSLSGYESGCRAYIAVSGGIDVPQVMGSRSTDLKQGFGGFEGRALRAGDRLVTVRSLVPYKMLRGRGLPDSQRPIYSSTATCGYLTTELPSAVEQQVVDAFDRQIWTLLPKSDRMGLRMEGQSLTQTGIGNMPSEPTQPGVIQCPNSGQPIVLMADAQTMGGYPTLGMVCTADLSTLAQVPPGGSVKFERIDEPSARAKLARQWDILRWLERANQSLL